MNGGIKVRGIFSREFYRDMVERVVSTAAQAGLAALLGTAVFAEVDWEFVGSTAALAAVACALKCVAASFKGDPDSASLVE